MRQVVFHFRSGAVRLVDVPPPALTPHAVRVRTVASVVSPGTERLLITLARRSLAGKAVDRPDLVARVWRKLRRDGLLSAVRTVRDRLGLPVPLGYAAAGVVTDVGDAVDGTRVSAGPLVVGDRVACAGAGAANHAEALVVPHTLVARIPAGVSTADAAFSTLGAIALNAVRGADVRLGDRVAVVGTGLLGTLAVRILRAAGARVLAIDPHPDRRSRATADGAEAVAAPEVAAAAGRAFTGGAGLDAVIVAAASSGDAAPMTLAAELVRRAGVVVALGDVPLSVPRRLAYAKEATLRVATSYGPGRYDRSYERAGRDYPLPYVRWTAGRNLEAFLGLLAAGRVTVADLANDVPIADAVSVYERLLGDRGGATDGRVARFVYPDAPSDGDGAADGSAPDARPSVSRGASDGLRTALIGAGAFARATLWPALEHAGLLPTVVVAATGPSAQATATRAKFASASTDADAAVVSADVHVVVIATPHDTHAPLVAAALRAGKHVFVEKPLATDPAGLASVEAALAHAPGLLAVGHNRRFSDAARRLRAFFDGIPGPTLCVYRVNAGPSPDDAWHGDPSVSGGRLVGEVCHMVDLLVSVCGELPTRVAAVGTRGPVGAAAGDDAILSIEFSGGSVATVAYHAMGDPTAGKERLEVVRGDRAAVLDDFATLTLRRDGKARRHRLSGEKGHTACARAFVAAVRAGGPPPVPYAEVLAVSRATLAARRALVSGRFERIG